MQKLKERTYQCKHYEVVVQLDFHFLDPPRPDAQSDRQCCDDGEENQKWGAKGGRIARHAETASTGRILANLQRGPVDENDDEMYTSARKKSESMNEIMTSERCGVYSLERGGAVRVTRRLGWSIASYQGLL